MFTISALLVPALVLGLAVALSLPLGWYLRWAMDPDSQGPVRRRYEAICASLLGGLATKEQSWKAYSLSLLTFNVLTFVFLYGVLAFQQSLPLNPDGKGALEPSLIFNTTASFVSNTNLQHYSGEAAMSYLSQTAGLMYLQFVSAATGIAALTALSRGLAGRTTMGNFYRDLWRATGLVLIPLSILFAGFFAVSGMPMTFDGAAVVQTLEGATQTIARGPVAAFVAIKQLGTNGGGWYGPNCTHPLENPTFWSNVVANLAILVIPMACVWMFGRIVGRMRHAAVLFGAMLVCFVTLLGFALWFENAPTRAFESLPVAESSNLEGKELRFGGAAGPTWAVSTTATSNGSVNAMHDSLNPLTGLIPMIGMWLNVVFGGDGVGLINMILYVIVAVFLSGMMVGRTPEYLARKVEAREMKLAIVALLAQPLCTLAGTAIFAATPWGLATIQDTGSHGFSEILYEFTSAGANNGSGFEGLGDNTVPWNVATGIVMLVVRFVPIIAPLAIAGSLAAKRPTPESEGTFRTDTVTFGVLLIATVLLAGALLFLPVAVLGPIAEHLATK